MAEAKEKDSGQDNYFATDYHNHSFNTTAHFKELER